VRYEPPLIACGTSPLPRPATHREYAEWVAGRGSGLVPPGQAGALDRTNRTTPQPHQESPRNNPNPQVHVCATCAYMHPMAGHHHHEHSGTRLVDAARDALVVAGEQWTEMRADVFAVLAGQGRPASAYDVAEAVSAARGRRVAANSVYRILDLFVRTNLARRVESSNAYIANSHPGCRHDCIFLICDACGQAVHIDDDRLTGALIAAAREAGFADVRPVVELRGHCADCS